MTKDFGLNAGLVSELVGMYLHDKSSVDEQWRAYIEQIIAGGERPMVTPSVSPHRLSVTSR